jgi:hypothetical protein
MSVAVLESDLIDEKNIKSAFKYAKTRREESYQYSETRTECVFKLGEIMSEMRQAFNRLGTRFDLCEAIFGFTTFKAYCAAPKEMGGLDIPYSSASAYALLYDKFIVELRFDLSTIKDIDYSKLANITRYVNNDNKYEVIDLCRSLPRTDMLLEIDRISKPVKDIKPIEEKDIPEDCENPLLEKVKQLRPKSGKFLAESIVLNVQRMIEVKEPDPLPKLLRYIESAIELD